MKFDIFISNLGGISVILFLMALCFFCLYSLLEFKDDKRKCKKVVKVKVKKKEAEWRICCDGWYPYCSNCCYEPPYVSNTDMRTPYCPNCGCKMKMECDK